MEMIVSGVKGVAGNAKATGNPFEMCAVKVMLAIERGKFGSVTITGYGFEESEIPCTPEAIVAFKQFEGRFPLKVLLEVDQRFFRQKLESVVVGVKPIVAAVKAS
jgi:hypothetical protein